MTEPAQPTKRGTIHDVGYKRYVGTRRSVATRWLVIMRQQIAMAWKKWWIYKMPLFGAVVTSFVAGGYIYFATNRLIRSFGARAHDVMLTMADGVIPLSFRFYCYSAFMLTMTLGATIVASDHQSGAFTFYYVRSIRGVDYVLGKLAGFGLLVAALTIAGPLVLACFRLGLSESTDDLVAHLHILPKVLVIGVLATVAYTTVPLALSSLVSSRRYALALWAAYYLIIGNIAFGLSHAISPSLAAIDIPSAVEAVTLELFDLSVLRTSKLGFGTAVIGLLLQSGVAIAILWYQVSRDHRTGVGGAS